MSELLKRDITIKSISVFFAVILWLFVSYSLNPVESMRLDIPLRITNENSLQEKALVLRNRNFPSTISITIRGKRDKLNSINFKDFDAVADLSRIKDADTKQVDIDVYRSKSDIDIDDIKPKTVSVQLEKIGKNPFGVEVVSSGKPKDSYKITKVSVTPQTLSLTGLDSLIKSVGAVKTFVDVSNIDRDTVLKKECKVYNKEGKEIPEFSKDLQVEVKIEVAKEVAIVGSIKGKPAKNFAESSISISPDKIFVAGPGDVLAKMNEIVVDPVDIENSEQNVKVKRTLKLPEGVRLVESPKDVTVTVVVEQFQTKELPVKKEEIALINTEIDNTLKYDIVEASVTLSLKGIRSDLQQLDVSRLKPSVDVQKLAEGTHKVPLKVVLPGTVKLVQDYTVEVKIEKR